MPRALRLAATLGLVLSAASLFAQARREPKIYRIAGAGRDERGKVIPQDLLETEIGGVRMAIRYLDEPGRRGALASVPGLATDLFPEKPEIGPGYLVFALELANGGAGDLIFEPGQGRLLTDRHDAEFPMDYTALYGLLTKRGPGAPRLDEVERAVFSRATTIKPEGSVRKLLVFPGPRDGKFKRLEVRLGALHVPERDLDATFEFRRFEVKP